MKKYIHTIQVPKSNPNDEQFIVVEVRKKINQNVNRNECIALLESSKVIFEIESPVKGKIVSIDIKVDDIVVVGQSIINIKYNQIDDKAQLSKQSNKLTNDDIHSIDDSDVDIPVSSALREKFDKRKKILKDDGINDKYKKNYLESFSHIDHGKDCFISFEVNLNNVELGDQVWINRNTTIFSNNKSNIIQIGSGSYIGPYNWIEGSAGIQIGECVHISGPGSSLYTHSGMKIALQGELCGNPSIPNRKSKNNYSKQIYIGNNVWIGPNCTIFPGTIINDYVVVLPNSLVKAQNIPSYTLVKNDGTIEYNSSFVKNLTKT